MPLHHQWVPEHLSQDIRPFPDTCSSFFPLICFVLHIVWEGTFGSVILMFALACKAQNPWQQALLFLLPVMSRVMTGTCWVFSKWYGSSRTRNEAAARGSHYTHITQNAGMGCSYLLMQTRAKRCAWILEVEKWWRENYFLSIPNIIPWFLFPSASMTPFSGVKFPAFKHVFGLASFWCSQACATVVSRGNNSNTFYSRH